MARRWASLPASTAGTSVDEVKSQTGVGTYLNLVTKYPGKPSTRTSLHGGHGDRAAVLALVKATVDNEKPERRNGPSWSTTSSTVERQRRSFYNALISEIGFPALDASQDARHHDRQDLARAAAFRPTATARRAAVHLRPNELQKQKMWLCSNFAFSLDRFKATRR